MQFLQLVTEDPLNYDNWFDYLKLLMNENANVEELRDTFERAIANIPPYMVKFVKKKTILFVSTLLLISGKALLASLCLALDLLCCVRGAPHKRL